MLLRSWATLFAASSLFACSSTALAPPREAARPADTCLTDPANGLMHCNGISLPFKESQPKMVCHPLEQWEAFEESCP